MRIETTYQNQTQKFELPNDRYLIGFFYQRGKLQNHILNILDGWFKDGIVETREFPLSDDVKLCVKLSSSSSYAELCKDFKHYAGMKMIEFAEKDISAQVILT